MMEREVSPKQVAASQANGQKSRGPKTPDGKARSSLNSLKTGAYAKTNNARREIMLRRGENPSDYEQFHQNMTEAWRPDDVMQEMQVKTIAEKSWEKEQLRAAWKEGELTSLQVGQIQEQRRQLRGRRWCPGALAVEVAAQGLWLAKDSPSKFKRIGGRRGGESPKKSKMGQTNLVKHSIINCLASITNPKRTQEVL